MPGSPTRRATSSRLLNLWNHLQEQQAALGSSAFRRLCRSEHLNYVRVREWADVHRQLSAIVGAPLGAARDAPTADPDDIHRAILSRAAVSPRHPRRTHGAGAEVAPAAGSRRAGRTRAAGTTSARAARGSRSSPARGCKKKRPAAVMAAELVETSRLFARTVAAVDPAWAEALAATWPSAS